MFCEPFERLYVIYGTFFWALLLKAKQTYNNYGTYTISKNKN